MIVARLPTARGTSVPKQAVIWLQACPAAAVFGIVGADVDGDQERVAAMGAQEGDRGGQLGTAG